MNLITADDKGLLPLVGDITGRVIVLKHSRLHRRYQLPRFQLFKATGGFGCEPDKLGTSVFGLFLADEEDASFRRSDFIGVASPDLIAKAMSDTTPVKDIDLDEKVYLLIAKDGSHEVGETLDQARDRLKMVTKSPVKDAYRIHPETIITPFGLMSYPKGAEPTVVRIKKGVTWTDIS